MSDRKLYFENRTNETWYLLLNAVDGSLQIHLYDRPYSNADEWPPLTRLGFPVDEMVLSCMEGTTLTYEFLSHRKGRGAATAVFIGGSRVADGLVFAIESLLN